MIIKKKSLRGNRDIYTIENETSDTSDIIAKFPTFADAVIAFRYMNGGYMTPPEAAGALEIIRGVDERAADSRKAKMQNNDA